MPLYFNEYICYRLLSQAKPLNKSDLCTARADQHIPIRALNVNVFKWIYVSIVHAYMYFAEWQMMF